MVSSAYQGMKVAGKHRPQWASGFHFQHQVVSNAGAVTPLHVAAQYGCRPTAFFLLCDLAIDSLQEFLTTWNCGHPLEAFPASARAPRELAVVAARMVGGGLDSKTG